MRNRNLILLLTALLAVVLVAGCGSTRPYTKAESDKITALQAKLADTEKIEDAKQCAPKEMAYLKAEIDGVRHESTESWEDGFKTSQFSASNIPDGDKKLAVLLAKLKECEEKKLVPMCGLVAEPDTVAPGKCATLKWKGENVQMVYFGEEDPKKTAGEALTGSKEVCPKDTTEYNMVCKGKWATNYETATVKVEVPPPPPPPVVVPAPVPVAPPAPKEATLRVNFDTAKYTIRPADLAELQKGVQFIKDTPTAKIHIVGYTDSRGGDKYNQKLSEQRAETVKKYLQGEVSIPAENISSEGKGEADPVGDNKTADGQFQNRRVVLTIK
jgi:outer membrane protein OmpA-like peptidoglycan-associated protein/outer membrane murein-binding lipoprotein Lpp